MEPTTLDILENWINGNRSDSVNLYRRFTRKAEKVDYLELINTMTAHDFAALLVLANDPTYARTTNKS